MTVRKLVVPEGWDWDNPTPADLQLVELPRVVDVVRPPKPTAREIAAAPDDAVCECGSQHDVRLVHKRRKVMWNHYFPEIVPMCLWCRASQTGKWCYALGDLREAPDTWR